MRLDIRALAIAAALLWGGVMLITGLANWIWPGYGKGFLQLLASIYPGYQASGTFGDLVVGILYAMVDGGLFGLIFAWLYNRFLGKRGAQGAVSDLKREAGVHYPPVEPGA